jgi:hypothetical protein
LSRNKGRVGSKKGASNPAPQHVIQNNEGSAALSFVVPTEFVDLPSEGKYYPEGHPLHGEDCIELKQMTAKEEDILSSRTLLKKGVALDRVIESIIVNKAIDPDSLLIGDRNAIIVATRVSGYGPDYTTKVTCPQCTTATKYEFDLREAGIYNGDDIDKLELADHEDGTFTVTLPKTHLNVRFRLLLGRDEKGLVVAAEAARKRKGAEHPVTRQLANMVIAVNEDGSAEAINYLINNIPSMDSRHLRMAYKLAAPNVDLTQFYECEECGHSQEMEVPLGAEFFWPDQ